MLLRVLGKGNIPGGNYEEIVARGNVKLDGLVKCNNLKGSGKLKGQSLECSESCKMSGRSSFAEKVNSKDLVTSGKFTCDGEIAVSETMTSKGVVKCDGSLNANAVMVSGLLKVCENIGAKVIKINGALSCNELNSKVVEINISGNSKIKSLSCDRIIVYTKGIKNFCMGIPLISILFKWLNKIVVENEIVGDEINLENLESPKVVGKNVVIGRGCKIDLVQYSDQVTISKKAKVGKVEKIVR